MERSRFKPGSVQLASWPDHPAPPTFGYYFDGRHDAPLVKCVTCRKDFYMSHPQAECIQCRRKK